MRSMGSVEPSRGFEREEFEARLDAVQRAMVPEGIDALLLTREPDVRYFSGYLTRFWESPSRPWFLIVPASGKPVAVIPSIGAELMATTWITDIRTWRAPDLVDDGVSLVSATLDELVGPGGRIALPGGQESCLRMPLEDFWRLQSLRAARLFVSDNSLVRRMRAIKSPVETEKIRHACGIAGRAFDRLDEVLRHGVSEAEIFRGFQQLCLGEGADFVPYVAGGFGPLGYSDVISPATSRPVATGEVIMLDTGLSWDGYFADFDRNVVLGKPDGTVSDCYKLLIEAVDAGFEAAKPGNRVCDLFAAMDRVVTGGKNSADSGRFGHGLGMELTEWPSIIPGEQTLLEPGMVLTLEPSAVVGDGPSLLVHEENIVITETGASFLSPRADRTLQVIDN